MGVSHASALTLRVFFRSASIPGEAACSGGERRGNAGVRGVPQTQGRALDTGVGLHPNLCAATGRAGGGFIAASIHCS